MIRYDRRRPIEPQIPADADVVHVQHVLPDGESIVRPRLFTLHGAGSRAVELDRDTVFISRDQAARFGSTGFIHNGFDWDDYGPPVARRPPARGCTSWGTGRGR